MNDNFLIAIVFTGLILFSTVGFYIDKKSDLVECQAKLEVYEAKK